jgi:DNA-binding XRE family transcriptional regulator
VQLRIIEQVPGDFQMEQRIHRALDAHRLHGEWFADVEAVREVIANPHSFGDAEEPETLGGRIRACRMRLGMDQTTFGWRVGVSQTQIARWESDRHEPRVSSIAAIARLAGVALSWLAYGEASEELAA